MSKHSWNYSNTAGHETHGQGVVSDENGKSIAIVYDGKAHGDLIAAAPAMYEALKKARGYAELKLEGFRREYSEDHAMVQTPLRLLETINAALAQAEGRQS